MAEIELILITLVGPILYSFRKIQNITDMGMCSLLCHLRFRFNSYGLVC